MLEGISTGPVSLPYLLLVYGVESIGKSSFGANAPGSIFIGPEAGTNNLNTSRFNKIKNYKDVLNAIEQLSNKEHKFQTVVIDSLDWIEPIIYAHICEKFKVTQIEDAGGGYGKYVNIIRDEWKIFIEKLNFLRDEKNMNIILIAHYHIKSFHDPSSLEPYERYMMKLQDKSSALFREWVDAVLFFNFETHVKKEKNMSKAKAFSDGERYIFSNKTAAYDAKNRFGLPGKIKLDHVNPFIEFEKVLKGSNANDLALLKQEIEGYVLDVTDKELLPKVKDAITNAGDNYGALSAIRDRLIEVTEKK